MSSQLMATNRSTTHRLLDLILIVGREDHADHRLRASFQHVLTFFVETGDDGIVLFERH
jgi:hypothetical protein